MRRVVEEKAILNALEESYDEATVRKLNRAKGKELITGRVSSVLEHAPTPEEGGEIPDICGLADAAEICGTQKAYINRMMDQDPPRLIPIKRLPSGPVFRTADVEREAARLREYRRAREERAAERDA